MDFQDKKDDTTWKDIILKLPSKSHKRREKRFMGGRRGNGASLEAKRTTGNRQRGRKLLFTT